jgi:hypothetical protein
MKHVHKILIAVFILSTAVVFSALYSISNFIFEKNRPNHLVSLREISTLACLSISRKQNDIVVFGDSHSYAAIDFYKLKELAGTEKISSCSMGGLYFETLIELLETLRSSSNHPKNIIYGLSLRQFTTGTDRQQQIIEHQKMISSAGDISKNIFLSIKNNIIGYFDKKDTDNILIQQRSNLLSRWTPLINSLDKYSVDQLFEKLDHSAKQNWNKYLQQLKFIESNNASIDKFCYLIKKSNANLFLVDIPESPYLQNQYKLSDVEEYKKIITKLSQCSKKVIQLTNEQWGVDSRHFLNRSLKPVFNFEELLKLNNQAPDALKSIAFDLDHINLVGAQIVTEKIYNEIKSEIEHAF